MLPRRVAQSLKDQNWTAIAIEFVLLVLGVFLGIQVSNWNAERENRQKAAVFTARLRDDLRAEGWRYQFLLAYYRDVRDATEATADALSDTRLADLTGNNRDVLDGFLEIAREKP